MTHRTKAVGLLALVVLAVVVVVGRRSFFYGEVLEVDDLTGEQQYRRCRRRLH